MQPIYKEGEGEIMRNKFYITPPEASLLSIYNISTALNNWLSMILIWFWKLGFDSIITSKYLAVSEIAIGELWIVICNVGDLDV